MTILSIADISACSLSDEVVPLSHGCAKILMKVSAQGPTNPQGSTCVAELCMVFACYSLKREDLAMI